MEADRSFRAWQERLRSNLRQWQESERDEGALLAGVPLAEGWLAEPGRRWRSRRGLAGRASCNARLSCLAQARELVRFTGPTRWKIQESQAFRLRRSGEGCSLVSRRQQDR
jgi:hypothetical protein